MKSIIRFIIMAASLVELSLFAQFDTASGLPVSVTTGSTSNVTVNMDVRKQLNTALMFKFHSTGVNTQNVTLTFVGSVDGSNYSDAPAVTWVFACPGNTNVYRISTNFAVNGYTHWRLKSVANAGSGDTIIPLQLDYSLKKQTN